MKQTVFITGVSSGVGHGLAHEYLNRGDAVIGISRRQPNDLLEYDNFRFASVDVTDQTAIENDVPGLFVDAKQIDTVILNAGMLGRLADMKDAPLEELKQLMEVNVWSNKTILDVLFAKCPVLKKVITISSGAAVNGNRGWSGYSISKAALNMLTMLYARENENTHFAAVAPGLVDTAIQDYLCGHVADDRFGSLEFLKSKRNTDQMPDPVQAAKRLIPVFDSIEKHVESGGFFDIRQLPNHALMEKI